MNKWSPMFNLQKQWCYAIKSLKILLLRPCVSGVNLVKVILEGPRCELRPCVSGVDLIASQIFAAVQERKAGYVSIYANTTGGLLLW